MSEYPKEIEGIIVNNSMEEQIAREELARAKIKLQVKNKKTFAKVQVAYERLIFLSNKSIGKNICSHLKSFSSAFFTISMNFRIFPAVS